MRNGRSYILISGVDTESRRCEQRICMLKPGQFDPILDAPSDVQVVTRRSAHETGESNLFLQNGNPHRIEPCSYIIAN